MPGAGGLAEQQRDIWDRIAPFWAAHRDSASDPRVEWAPPLPAPTLRGARVLELGCGDGRRGVDMAVSGANVLATDASALFVSMARARADRESPEIRERFTAKVVDATDSDSLAGLEGDFDVVVADMVLMNLIDLKPLALALPRLIGENGRFLAMVLHPCFPSPFFVDVDDAGRPTGTISQIIGAGQRVGACMPARFVAAASRVVRPFLARPRPYLPEVTRRVAVPGQPEPHFNVHRPLGSLLQPFFDEGLVLHGLSEGLGEGRLMPSLVSLDLRLARRPAQGLDRRSPIGGFPQ